MSIIYLTDFLPVSNDEQMSMIDVFIQDMEKTFGGEVQKMSIADVWMARPPTDADGQSVREYLADVRIPGYVLFALILNVYTGGSDYLCLRRLPYYGHISVRI